jgi:AraC-like DNA-binding protein
MYVAIAPRSPRLAPFVESLGYHESALPPGRDRVLPNGTMGLMINLEQDELRTYHGPGATIVRRAPGAVLCGPDPRAVVIDTEEQRRGLSVSFTIGGAAALFALPFGETAGQLVGLSELWGRDGALLRERLLEASTPRRQLAVLEQVLLDHLLQGAGHYPDQAIGYAAAELERGRLVRHVRDDLGLLARTFTRRFEARTGLTPKRFARIRRLQRVVTAAGPASSTGLLSGTWPGQEPRPTDWARLAADHGYCDQSHLIDDFRDIAGITPGAYRPRSAEERNHLPVT